MCLNRLGLGAHHEVRRFARDPASPSTATINLQNTSLCRFIVVVNFLIKLSKIHLFYS